MNVRKAEIVGVAALLALVLFGFYQTSLIDLTLSSELETFTGPRAYPRIILGAMLLLLFFQLLKLGIDRNNVAGTDTSQPRHPRLTKVVVAIATLVLFSATFEPLGYLITVIPLLVAAGYLNGARSPSQIVVFSVIAAAICLVVFRYGLNTVLPEGVFGIDKIF